MINIPEGEITTGGETAANRRGIFMKAVDALVRSGWFELLARWVLGAVFIYASYHKIIAPAQFAKVIYGYYLFPPVAINLIAIILPFVEFICGLGLITGIYPRSAALIINVLLIVFIAVLSINLVRGREFDCGCFSIAEGGYTGSVWELLFRDIVLLGFGLQVIFFSQPRKWCILQSGSILHNVNGSGEV